MFSEFDQRAMTRALALAERGLETTNPNPRVGCVIAKGERIIAEGWHERAGEAHAEVVALRAAKEPVVGATAYVTLEPCSHHGRTPPCVNSLIEARLARVVFAVQDPNPQVSGQGAEALLRAGITVEAGLMEAEATELNIGFMKRMKHGLPWVRIKLAMSLDGRTALANGASQWITGEAARFDVQRWRARSSAVMTGVGTVLFDDPQLNVRATGYKGRQPLRVVLDSYLRSPPAAKVFASSAASAGVGGASGARAGVGGGSGACVAGVGEAIVFAALGGGVAAATGGGAPGAGARGVGAPGPSAPGPSAPAASTPAASTPAASTPAASTPATGDTAAATPGIPSGTAELATFAGAGTEPPMDPAGSAAGNAMPNGGAEVSGSSAGSSAGSREPIPDDGTWKGAALSGGAHVIRQAAVSAAWADRSTKRVISAAEPATAAAGSVPRATANAAQAIEPAASAGGMPAASAGGMPAASAEGTPAAMPARSTPGATTPAASTATPASPNASDGPPSPATFEARRAALQERGVRVEEVAADDGFLDMLAVCQRLAQLEVNEVLVEAGPTLAGQLLTTFFADELLLYIAPKLLGPQGRPLVHLPELQSLQDAWGFSLVDAKRFGEDLRLRFRPK